MWSGRFGFLAIGIIGNRFMVDSHAVARHFVGGSKVGGDFAVEGGKLGFEGFQSLFLIIASYRSKCSASTLLTNDLIEHGESFSWEMIRLII